MLMELVSTAGMSQIIDQGSESVTLPGKLNTDKKSSE